MTPTTWSGSTGDKDLKFALWLAEEGYAGRTVELYGLYIERARRWLSDRNRSLARATEADLRSWWSTLPPSSSSRNVARHALIAYDRYRGKKNGGNASALPRIPAPLGVPRPVDEETFAVLIRTAHDMGGVHEAIGCLLGYTGCRIGEATHARWSQFDLGSDPVWYAEGKGSRRSGPKVRAIPLNEPLVDVLRRWQMSTQSPDWVFPSQRSRSGHLHHSFLRQMIYDIADQANMDRVNPHRWRHSVATIALEETNDLRAVADLLGHANVATTHMYTRVARRRLRALVDVLPAAGSE